RLLSPDSMVPTVSVPVICRPFRLELAFAAALGLDRASNARLPMPDLNDLYYFAKVVEHHGFAPAGRSLGVPKSRLSRRIAQLEARLGVRLIQRSTRRFSVTETGQIFYTHCKAML